MEYSENPLAVWSQGPNLNPELPFTNEPGVLPTHLVSCIFYTFKKASAELGLHVYACNVKRLITPDSLNSICIQNFVTMPTHVEVV